MIWHDAAPCEGGDYYWRSDSRSPIFTVGIRESRGGRLSELAALLSPEFAHEISGQWSDRLPDPECRTFASADTIPMRRRQI